MSGAAAGPQPRSQWRMPRPPAAKPSATFFEFVGKELPPLLERWRAFEAERRA